MNRIKWIDAIRVLGLFLVLGYHLFYGGFPGGFLGVDVFLTLSGYLITVSILREAKKKDGFNPFAYLKRRFVRIFPPLLVSVAVTMPFLLLISPDFSVGIAKQAAAALGFVTNWFEILTGGSYEGQLIPHLYVHTWFLAVEMQYYVAWGAVCAAAAVLAGRLSKRTGGSVHSCFRKTLFAASVVLAAGSFLCMRVMYDPEGDLSAVYFNTFARAFPFFLGSAAAALWGLRHRIGRRLNPRNRRAVTYAVIAVMASAGLATVLFAVNLGFSDGFVYRYGFFITSLLSAVLILGANSLHTLAPKVRQPAVIGIAADMSYSVYLYHWPVYIIVSALILNNYDASAVTLAVSAAVSAFIMYGVGGIVKRIVKLADKKNGKRIIASASASAAIIVLAACMAVMVKAPDITSIEGGFTVGYVYQDIEKIKSLKRSAETVRDMAVLTALEDGFPELNLLPEPVITPSPAPPQRTEPAQETPLPESAPTTEPSPVPQPTQEPVRVAEEQAEPSPEPETAAEPDRVKAQPEPEPAQSASATQEPSPEPEPADEPEREQAPPTPDRTRPPAATPEPTPEPAVEVPKVLGGVTVIGDSVALGAQTTLVNSIADCQVDARVSRQINSGHDYMMELIGGGKLREYVVIALGTNGNNNYAKLLTKFIDDLPAGHRLIFVTPYDGRSNANAKAVASTAVWIRELPGQYNFITVADWNKIISSQSNLLAGDKVHMSGQKSMTLYTECITDAISIAAQKPAKQ